MTTENLRSILQNGGHVHVPYFGGAEVEVMECEGIELAPALVAFENFLKLTPEDRVSHSRHLFAYYKLMIDACGDELIEKGKPIPQIAEDVWKNTYPSYFEFTELEDQPFVKEPTIFVMLGASVDWEVEHGLLMSWREGRKLVRVGAYDGHQTNGYAANNMKRDKFIHDGYKEEFCTYPDATL